MNLQRRVKAPVQGSIRKCEVCGKEAQFICSECKNAAYCTLEHQKTHWHIHKYECRGQIYIDRRNLRRKYYEEFGSQRYVECLDTVKLMLEAQEKNLVTSIKLNDEFEHASVVCLLIRTFLFLDQKMEAKLAMENFLKYNRILSDTRSLPKFREHGKLTPEELQDKKQFFEKKLALIATLANLSYALGKSPIDFYIMYTQNIQYVFGEQSFEGSNCYFLVGCYYAEESQFLKAYACFKRAAQIREGKGEEAADCYFNMAHVLKKMGKVKKAVDMMQKALAKRKEVYGENALECAQVYENLAIVHLEDLDFASALKNLETAYFIRNAASKSMKSTKSAEQQQKLRRLVDLIGFLYQKLDAYIASGMLSQEKTQIFSKLKESIFSNATFNGKFIDNLKNEIDKKGPNYDPSLEQKIKQREAQRLMPDPNKLAPISERDITVSENSNELDNSNINNALKKGEGDQEAQKALNFKLKIDPEVLEKLTPFETYHLSELQLDLEDCETQYRAVLAVNNSKFVKSLTQETLKLFQEANPHIFGEVHISAQKLWDKKPANRPVTPKLDMDKLRQIK